MAQIHPFRAIRYNPAVVGDLQKVVAPPYDVISPEQQTLLHLQSPYNAVHLDFNKESDPYAAAAQTFQTWLSRQVVQQDPEAAFYCYSQEYTLKDGEQQRRTGIFTALRLEEFEFGMIRPHERTFEPAKKDRLALLRACQAHLSSIFCLYAGSAGSAGSNWSLEQTLQKELAQPAAVDIQDDAGVTHRLWPITNPDAIADLRARLADETLIIADGHHRYETALQYCREQASEVDANGSNDSTSATGEEPFRYVLAYLTNAQDVGLTILPTHRLIQQARLPSRTGLQAVLKRDFRLARYALTQRDAFLDALAAPEQNGRYGQERRIGCVLTGAEHYWLLSFNDRVTHGLPASEAMRGLDVTVLHDVIFQRFLGLPPEVQKETVSYTSDGNEALRLVAEGQSQAAFLLRSTTFEQIKRVCEGGETMPQKSTYFYPKLLTGLVFYHLGKE